MFNRDLILQRCKAYYKKFTLEMQEGNSKVLDFENFV